MARWPDIPLPIRLTAVLLLMSSALVFRVNFSTRVMPPPARMQGEATQAYRYARMVSRGENIPGIDTMAMHPRGFPTGQNSIFEEYIAGGLHRIIGGGFDRFLRLFCLIFPLLVMPGMYLWMQAAGFSGRRSLLGAALYGIALPALLRARGESLYRETVALPLIVFLCWALEKAVRAESRRLPWALTAGLFLFVSLAAWKVTGFLAVFIFLYLLFSRRVPRDPRLLLPLGAAQLAGALLLSHMRHDGISPATVLAVFTMATCIPAGGLPGLLPWLGSGAALIAGILSPESGGHVSGVILAKFRFLFRHPSNPLLLSPDARLFWVGGYTSPTPGEFVLLFGPLMAVAFAGIRRFTRTAAGGIMLPFLFIALAGYLFFDRLHVFLAVALVPLLAVSVKKPVLTPLLFVLVGGHSLLSPHMPAMISGLGLDLGNPGASLLTDGELDRYLDWVEGSTAHDEAFLAYWHLSGLTSAYGERPTVLHTFFENRDNRRNIVSFASALYQDEEAVTAYMESHEARYLVYQADFTLDLTWQGAAYLGGVTRVSESSAAFQMQYSPETLTRLVQVWQGPSLRVFQLDGTPVPWRKSPLFVQRYRRFFDYESALALVSEPVGTGLALASRGMARGEPDAVSAGLLVLSGHPSLVPSEASIGLLQFLVQSHLAGAYGIMELEEDFEAYLWGWGPDREVRMDIARLLDHAGLSERARYHAGQARLEEGAP